MRMKKMFTLIASLALLLAFTSPSWAINTPWDDTGFFKHTETGAVKKFENGHPGEPSQWVPCNGNCVEPEPTESQFVTGSSTATAYDIDTSLTDKGNDFGQSRAEGWNYGHSEGYADGSEKAKYNAYTLGFSPDVFATSFANDFGKTSNAGATAGMKNEWIRFWFFEIPNFGTYGEGFALGAGPEYSYSEIGLGGSLWQENGAAELWGNDFALGYNQSGLDFYATNNTSDIGQSSTRECYWYSKNIPGAKTGLFSLKGEAITTGFTTVTIDNTGAYRSADAFTKNSSSWQLNPCQTIKTIEGNVYGSGNVNAQITNGGAVAAGAGSFSYNGYSSGMGYSRTQNSVNVMSGSTYVHSSTVSYAEADLNLNNQ